MTSPVAQQRLELRRAAARLKARKRGCRVPALFLLTDDDRTVDWVEAVAALPRGAAVIVRARDPKRRAELALTLKKRTAPSGILLLIADDAKLAFRLRASGVHVPDRNGEFQTAVRRMMPGGLNTFSTHNSMGLHRAARAGASAVFLSPLFSTASHSGKRALGTLRWALVARTSTLPIIALGGIAPESAKAAIAVGASALGVIGSWTAAIKN